MDDDQAQPESNEPDPAELQEPFAPEVLDTLDEPMEKGLRSDDIETLDSPERLEE